MSSSSELGGISRWTEIGASYDQFREQGDIQSCVNLITTICQKVPEIGQFVSLVRMLVSEREYNQDFQEVNRKLECINKQLFVIDNKVNQILDKVKEMPHIIEYKRYLDKLHQLQDSYTRHVRQPTSDTTAILKQKCITSDMYDFIMWCNREVDKNSFTPVIKYMMDGYCLEKFLSWANMIMVHVKQAIVLHIVSVCMRCEIINDIETTLRSDVEQFNVCLANIENTFTKYIEEIQVNYWVPAQADIEHFLRDNYEKYNVHYPNWGLPEPIAKMLNRKYPWRDWVVVSWYYEAHEGELNYDKNFGRVWKREDIYIFVTSQKKGFSEISPEQSCGIEKIVRKHARSYNFLYRGAAKVASNVQDDLKRYSIRDVVCFQEENGFRPLLGPWRRWYSSSIPGYGPHSTDNLSIHFYNYSDGSVWLMLLVILK